MQCRFRPTYALVVDDLDNGGQTAGVRSVAEEDNAADFHHPPLRGLDLDICLTHCDGYALDDVSLVILPADVAARLH